MARSPVWTGSGCSSESRACRPPRGRTCTGTDAAPRCSTSSAGRSSAAPPSRTSSSDVVRHWPGESRACPRVTCSRGTPLRLTATRDTACTCSRCCPSCCRPRTRTGTPSSSSSSPTARVPAARVPVTTVPLPWMVNARSTQSLMRASRSGAGSRAARSDRPARSSGRPWPVRPDTATAGTSPSEVLASCSRASAMAGAGSVRSLRVTASRPWVRPRAWTAARCSADWRRHPSSAATTKRTAGAGPSPASMLPMNRWCPGTSTNARSSPEGSVVQA